MVTFSYNEQAIDDFFKLGLFTQVVSQIYCLIFLPDIHSLYIDYK